MQLRLFKPSACGLGYHTSHESRTNSLLLNWSATGRSEGSENVIAWIGKSHSYSDLKVPNLVAVHSTTKKSCGGLASDV